MALRRCDCNLLYKESVFENEHHVVKRRSTSISIGRAIVLPEVIREVGAINDNLPRVRGVVSGQCRLTLGAKSCEARGMISSAAP
jgi:hypothetical protein